MEGGTAREVKRLVTRQVDQWRTKYKLCITSAVRENHRWLLRGMLSKPTALQPIPEGVVHIAFRVEDGSPDGSFKYRLEQDNFWHRGAGVREPQLDRIVAEKALLSGKHASIVYDDFGTTREQLEHEQVAAEEAKIAKEKEMEMFSDESDEEYFDDEVVFRGRPPQYEQDPEDIVRNMYIHISEVVESIFDKHKASESGLLGYSTCKQALAELREELNMDQDDTVILSALFCEDEAMMIDLNRTLPLVVQTLQFRLTHSSRAQVATEWSEEYLSLHSPGFAREAANIVQRVATHLDNNAHVMSRASLRESLENDGEGLLKAEINAIMALHKEAEGCPTAVVVLPEPQMLALLFRVRLAFARDAALHFQSVEALEDHFWALLTGGRRLPREESESKEEEGKRAQDLTTSRTRVYNALMQDTGGVVLSKCSALALLVTCPSVSESEDILSVREFVCSAARYCYSMHNLYELERMTVLAERARDLSRLLVQDREPDEFNSELWRCLEGHFPERGVPAMSALAFADCMIAFLGESIPQVAIESIAAINADPKSTSEVLCNRLARRGYDYSLLVGRVWALLEHLKAEQKLTSIQQRFQADHGKVQVSTVAVEGETVRVAVVSGKGNAERAWHVGELAMLLAEEPETLLQEELDPGVQAALEDFAYLDDKCGLHLHVPLW